MAKDRSKRKLPDNYVLLMANIDTISEKINKAKDIGLTKKMLEVIYDSAVCTLLSQH